jgi:voltage-gated potassium channel
VPAFAFLTLYSILVIVFACLYRLVDVASAESYFRIGDEVRDITFPEALYFSVSTLSTVGYGDIAPLGNLMRLIAVFEVVAGVLLFMFGVSELLTYSRERRKNTGGES